MDRGGMAPSGGAAADRPPPLSQSVAGRPPGGWRAEGCAGGCARWLSAAGLVLVALVYWGVAVRTSLPVGFWSDDAVYVTTARSLAQGTGYRHLEIPGEPLQTRYPPLYPAILAHAYATSGRYEDAIEAAEIIIEHQPDTLDALLILIGSYTALGRHQDAQRSVEAVRSYYPRFRVDTFASTQPYIDPSQLERVTEALKSAGLE